MGKSGGATHAPRTVAERRGAPSSAPKEPLLSSNGKRVGRPPNAGMSMLAHAEAAIAGLAHERAYLLDASGERVLLSKAGSERHVEFTPEERAQMAGGVLTHNHPNGASFSHRDVALAASEGLAEIRAVTRNATYSMRPPTGRAWSAHMYQNEVLPVIQKWDAATWRHFHDLIARGAMTAAQAKRSHLDYLWRHVAQETGLRYERIPRQVASHA